MTLHTHIGHCAACGHPGSAHTIGNVCLAQVARGIAGGRRGTFQCHCVRFVPRPIPPDPESKD